MRLELAFLSKSLLRAGTVLFLAIGASACSTIPDWVDPTTWIGGSDDQTQTASTDDQSAQTANNGQTPDLSTIPDKPNAPSTDDEQRQVAQSLASDRARAQYSADALKGGTEAAAAPPPADTGPTPEEVASNDTAPAAPAPAPAPLPQTSAPGTLPGDNPPPAAAPAPTPVAAPAAEPAVPAQATTETASTEMAPPPAAPTTQVASAETAPPAAAPMPYSAAPAVPALAPNRIASSDSALGFRPSSAPPLDPSVAQFVPASILARYQQTAVIGQGMAAPTMMANLVSPKENSTRPTRLASASSRKHSTPAGGPEIMSGAVVANFDALHRQGAAVPMKVSAVSGGPAAVVFFPNDTTVLSGEARAQVRLAARSFIAQGGQGYVCVIGHSSSRTGNMTADRHLVWNFERSQARANAVARALIGDGVPAEKVLVQAVSDRQPVYQESMPQGDDGNRRAEIFFQS